MGILGRFRWRGARSGSDQGRRIVAGVVQRGEATTGVVTEDASDFEDNCSDFELALAAAEEFNLPCAGNVYRFSYYKNNPDVRVGVDFSRSLESPGNPSPGPGEAGAPSAGLPKPR